MYSLWKVGASPPVGDSGGMSVLIGRNPDTNKIEIIDGDEPTVDCAIRVGSSYARSFSQQDWWQTSRITRILVREKTDDKLRVVFTTLNSTYEWTKSL